MILWTTSGTNTETVGKELSGLNWRFNIEEKELLKPNFKNNG